MHSPAQSSGGGSPQRNLPGVGLDHQRTRVRYGANAQRAAQLHSLFYCAKSKKLVYRSDTQSECKGLPHCSACGTQISGKGILEKARGRCIQCAKCPYCMAKLHVGGVPGDEDRCCLACPTCKYTTASIVAVKREDNELESADALLASVIAAEKERRHEDSFAALQAHLEKVVKETLDAPSGGVTSTEEAALERRNLALGGRAMGMGPEALAAFERKLEEKQSSHLRRAHRPASLSLQEMAESTEDYHTVQQEASHDGGEVLLLPERNLLTIRSSVRYQKQLLSTETDLDGHRRLNRSATLLFPRVFVCGGLPDRVEEADTLSLRLAFVNPASTPCAIAKLTVVQSAHAAASSVPEGPFELSARPEIDTHRYPGALAEGASADAVEQWDNIAVIPCSVTVGELPVVPPPGSGVGLTVRVDYRHAVDSVCEAAHGCTRDQPLNTTHLQEVLETPVYHFVVAPFVR